MPDLTPETRRELAELAAAATAGPWTYQGRCYIETGPIHVTEADWGEFDDDGNRPHNYRLATSWDSNAWRVEDCQFVAAAREAVPALLAALDAAEAERDRAVAHQLSAERERLWAANELAAVVERLEAAENALKDLQKWFVENTHDDPLWGPQWGDSSDFIEYAADVLIRNGYGEGVS